MFFRRSRELNRENGPASISGEIWENGFSTGSDSESKFDEVTVQAIEAALREGKTLNNEEARALLGRIEYQKENFQVAVQIFDGIQSGTIFNRIKFLSLTKPRYRRGRSRNDVSQEITVNAAAVLLEAVYWKVMALEKLGRLTDAAYLCDELLDSYESAFPQGLPEGLKMTKIQEFLNRILAMHPAILTRQGLGNDAVVAYRRAIRAYWSSVANSEHVRLLQLELAKLLLYGGLEGPACPSHQYQGGFLPSNNMEEAIFLLLRLAGTSLTSTTGWDPTVMEHLCYALSVSGHFEVLAQLYEYIKPGIYTRTDRWYNLALCYSAAGDSRTALDVLRKCLNKVEKPNDVPSLMLAASTCQRAGQAAEGAAYARQAGENAQDTVGYLRGRAWHILGVALSEQAKSSLSNTQRSGLQKEALSCLKNAVRLEKLDPIIRLDIGVEYAEQGNIARALDCAKKALELSCGAKASTWRFLALVLSAQGRLSEADVVIQAGLKEAGKFEKVELLYTKAKLLCSQGKTLEALETYKLVLALEAQAPNRELWLEMAGIYTSLSQWKDAEDCLEKARGARKADRPDIHCSYGNLYRAREEIQQAIASYTTALTLDPSHVESKVQLGATLTDCGGNWLPAARTYLNDALRSQPRHPVAWFNLGRIHQVQGRLDQAADCFQAAYLLEQSEPIESYASRRA